MAAMHARSRTSGLTTSAVAWLAAPDEALIAADLRWLEAAGARLLPATSARIPAAAARVAGRARGALRARRPAVARIEPQLAMVGSRNPTAGGRATAREFASFFARAGLTITSGLALGIDAACHEGALAADGFTVAVLGCGLDQIYPAENRALAERIAALRRTGLGISAGHSAAAVRTFRSAIASSRD